MSRQKIIVQLYALQLENGDFLVNYQGDVIHDYSRRAMEIRAERFNEQAEIKGHVVPLDRVELELDIDGEVTALKSVRTSGQARVKREIERRLRFYRQSLEIEKTRTGYTAAFSIAVLTSLIAEMNVLLLYFDEGKVIE